MKIKLMTAYSGGPYRWGVDLAKGLEDRGIEIRQVTNRVAMLFNLMHQSGIDIVHSTVPLPFKVWRKPLVVTIKGDYTIEYNIYQKYYPRLIEQADIVTTPSEYMKGKIGMPDAVVIPNAIYPETCIPVQHRKRQDLNIATVMNFFFKGKADGLIKLAELMNRMDLPGFRYIVVGDGPYCKNAMDIAKSYGNQMKFSGFLQEPRLVLGNSDIFLYYSYHDNFPNVILEAMAYGLPVITNQVGAVSEIIKNGYDGFVAQNDNEYMEILEILARDVDLRKQIGGNARRSVEEHFNWADIIGRYVKIYERLN